MAQSRHPDRVGECPLSGAKRTSKLKSVTSAFGPKADMGFPELLLRKIAVEPHFADRRFLFELRLI